MRGFCGIAVAAAIFAAGGACSPGADRAPVSTAVPPQTAPLPPSAVGAVQPTLARPQDAAAASAPAADAAPTQGTGAVMASLRFVENADCEAVSRERLPSVKAVVRRGPVEQEVIAEVASTTAQQRQGLMCRALVPAGTGMLFLFDQASNGGFWMFNTYAALDILYIGASGLVVDGVVMRPCPRAGTSESPDAWRSRCGAEAAAYVPDAQYVATLELPAGWLEANDFPGPDAASGTAVSWDLPR